MALKPGSGFFQWIYSFGGNGISARNPQGGKHAC
jgi:hypothetical protein